MLEWVPFPVGRETSPNILNDADESTRRGFESELRGAALVVRRARKKHREPAVRLRPVDIRTKDDPVPHLGKHTALHNHFVVVDRLNHAGSQNQSYNCRPQRDPLANHDVHSPIEPQRISTLRAGRYLLGGFPKILVKRAARLIRVRKRSAKTVSYGSQNVTTAILCSSEAKQIRLKDRKHLDYSKVTAQSTG